MKNKITLLAISLVIFSSVSAQKKSDNQKPKCIVYHDKETNRDLYKRVEVFPTLPDTINSEAELVINDFRIPETKYRDNLKVRFAWIVEKDGSSTFVNLWYPDDIPEIKEEAKRFVKTLPLYKPAMCGSESVAYKMDIEFPLNKKGQFVLGPERLR